MEQSQRKTRRSKGKTQEKGTQQRQRLNSVWWSLCLGIILLYGCDLEQDFDIDLPAYESQLVVECYLETGKPYRLTLSESQAYLGTAELPIIEQAEVFIWRNDERFVLEFSPQVDSTEQRFYNFLSEEIVEAGPDDIFRLEITDDQGRSIQAITKLPDEIRIDSLEARFRESDSLAFLRIQFRDPDLEQDNFFRFQVNQDSLTGEQRNDLNLDDRFQTNGSISIGTNYNYESQDTLIVTLYHLNESHYRYIESVDAAIRSNLNPFAQPAFIQSGVEGGIGVFTLLRYERQQFIVP